MNFLSFSQCAEWFVQRGIDADERGPLFDESRFGFSHNFAIPSDAGQRVALARVLWENTEADSAETMLWATYCHAWPSGQHAPLAMLLRDALGESRPINVAPGCLVRTGESDDGLSLYVVAILFLWDCWIVNANASLCVFISHDEYGVVYCQNNIKGTQLADRLGALTDATEQSDAVEP